MSTSWQPTPINAPRIDAPRITTRPIASLRWWIGGLLFLSTIINYVDRQTLSLLAPFLKQDYHWTNTDYANLLIGFRVGYSVGQTVLGRLVDRIGTRRGLSITVFLYSIISIATWLTRGFYSFATLRCLLGTAESANWPGATKAVSEWFAKRERGLATALFDSGSSVGGAIAPFIVLGVYFRWGGRLSFVLPGLLGLSWLMVWRKMYYPPQEHPRISQQELQMILADGSESDDVKASENRQPWQALLKLPQTWGAY
jgi:MFS transporter, ACS family, hexuronate transporter